MQEIDEYLTRIIIKTKALIRLVTLNKSGRKKLSDKKTKIVWKKSLNFKLRE